MYAIPPVDYIVMSLILFSVLYSFHSYLTTSITHPSRVVALTHATTLLSTLFTNIGEAAIILGYFWWLMHSHRYTDGLFFVLLWEAYDIIDHIIVVGILFMSNAFPNNVHLIVWIVPGLFTLTLAIVSAAYMIQHKDAPKFSPLLSKVCRAHPIVLAYPLLTCLFLSLINTIADGLASTKIEWFIFSVSATLIVANYIIFYYVFKLTETMVANEIYLSSESARSKYNQALTDQQVSTANLFHDMQNILMAIEANLSRSERNESNIEYLINSGRRRLAQSQPNQSLLTQVHTVALRNIIYLLWLQSTQQGIDCNIMASGNIEIHDAPTLSTTLTDLKQIVAVAIKSASQSSIKRIEISLLQQPSSVKIEVQYRSSTFDSTTAGQLLDSLTMTQQVHYLETFQDGHVKQDLIVAEDHHA